MGENCAPDLENGHGYSGYSRKSMKRRGKIKFTKFPCSVEISGGVCCCVIEMSLTKIGNLKENTKTGKKQTKYIVSVKTVYAFFKLG